MQIIRVKDSAGIIRFASLNPDSHDAIILAAANWEELMIDRSSTGTVIPADKLEKVPLVAPSKVVAMACAYTQDPEQDFKPGVDKDPFFFLKPPSAIIATDQAIEIPPIAVGSVFESELAAVIGKSCRGVKAEDALDYVLGYTICNDMSAPSVMLSDGQWSRGKGFDTFCPIGPVIQTEIDNPEDVLITAVLVRDGIAQEFVRQSTATQIWSVARSIEYCSQFMTLEPGDIVSFGCPPGPVPVRDGDVIEVSIEGIGTLRNPIKYL